MPDPAHKPWTLDEFFAWQARQPERYELVNGFPLRMMAGAGNVHNDIVINLLAGLRGQLRGTGCRPFNGDGSIETVPGQIRRPDAGVDCGVRDPDGLKAASPRMIAEVLSPTTRDYDTFDKLAEYKQVESLEHILLVEPSAAEVVAWSRGPGRAWVRQVTEGLDATVTLPGIGVQLPMAEIYDGVAFPARPRLVRREDGPPDTRGQSARFLVTNGRGGRSPAAARDRRRNPGRRIVQRRRSCADGSGLTGGALSV